MNARARILAAALLVAGTAASFSSPARAQQPGTASDRAEAEKDFKEGNRAFKEGDYKHAAESYERAYRRLPNHHALWNAARSWHHAGELAHAANLYAQYLREAPANAKDRNSAQKALKELSNRLARVEIHATDIEDVKVDGIPIDAPSVYVTPGAHVVEGKSRDGRPVRQSQNAEAGDVVSVALVPPPPKEEKAAAAEPAKASHGWSPTVVYVGGALTGVLTAGAVVAGLITLNQKSNFDQNPTQKSLDTGKQDQFVTNVFIASAAGVGVLTIAAAVFLVDWHGKPPQEKEEKKAPEGAFRFRDVRLGIGPFGILSLRGEF